MNREPRRPPARLAVVVGVALVMLLAAIPSVPAATPAAVTGDPAASDPVLVGAGDIASCADNRGAEATAALVQQIPGTVFTLGDNAYVDGTAAQFAQCYDPTWGRFKDRTGLPVPGNHDYNTPGAAGFYGYFGAAAGDPAKGYYDKMIGTWHVIVLNTNCEAVGGCGAGSPQERWLRSVLASSEAQCTLALWHEPAFSSATVHRAFPLYQPFWQALYDYGADVVLDGSDHVYERFGLQTPAGDADPAFGLRQFTVGTGGRSHQSFKIPLPNSEVRNGGTYGVLSLTLHPGAYDWRFNPVAGQKFTDSGTQACHGAPAPPAPDPGPITAVGTASGGSKLPATGITLGRPAGTGPGQVLLASIASDQTTPAFGAPAGWTVVQDSTVKGRLRQTVYEKVAGDAEPASYTWTTRGKHHIAGGITAYAGVDTGHPIDAVSRVTVAAAGTALKAPGVTTTRPGDRLVTLDAVNAEGRIDAPAGMTARWESAAPTGGTTDALAASADATVRQAGPTGPRQAKATERGPRIAVLVALRPALQPPVTTTPAPSVTTPTS
ncbi:MAG TPA: metallophosphoesterase [Acidimicrobiia bacterium]|nr:metallophosphoesterase [Acidimicrobiia bacterium]